MATEGLRRTWNETNNARREAAREESARLIFFAEMVERREKACQHAKDLLDKIGLASSEDYMASIRDTSHLVHLGLLGEPDERGRAYGFATVYLNFDVKAVTRQTKGRFFTRTDIDEEKSDVINDFGVLYYAGKEDGSDLECFAGNHWHIIERDDMNLALGVESSLDELDAIVSATTSQ